MTDMRRIASEHRRTIWIIVAALAVNAALYALVVRPLSQRAESGQQEAGAATREVVAARRAFDAAHGTVSGKKLADDELRKFYREVLPADLSGARNTMFHVEQLARDSNLTLLTRRQAVEAGTDKDPLHKLTLTMNLAGDYTNIRHFIHELETAPEFLVLQAVSVTQGADGSDDLNVAAQVATYYRNAGNAN